MPLVPNPGPPQGTHLGDPTQTQHTERQNIAGGREGDMPEWVRAGVTDERRREETEFGPNSTPTCTLYLTHSYLRRYSLW